MSDREDREVLEKLLELAEGQDVTIFDEDEVKTLKRVIKIVTAIETLGSLGSMIKSVLIWFSVMIGLYLGFKNGLVTWIVGLR